MENSNSIKSTQQLNLFEQEGCTVPALNLFEQSIFTAIEQSGTTGMTTQDLRGLARNPTAAITALREAGCNIISIPLGPVFDPVMQRTVRNTVKYVLGSPRFISPKRPLVELANATH